MQSADNLADKWIKSSFSAYNTNCVEVSGLSGEAIRVRDSQNPRGGILNFTTGEWDTFIKGVRSGEFDRGQGTL
jgi:uncharacterized protein DUF397